MKYLTVVLLVALAACAHAATRKQVNLEDIDIRPIMNNQRLMKNYIACVLDKSPCTSEGRELKKSLPDALKSECAKCSPKQKANARTMARFIRDKRPLDWEALLVHFDPKGESRHRINNFVNSSD